MTETRLRVTFIIEQLNDGDGHEIGFGSSTACLSIDDAAYEIGTLLQRREWETEPGMPEPETVL